MGDWNAAVCGLTFESFVNLHMTFGGHQIVLCGLVRDGLVVVVFQQPLKHVACALREIGVRGEGADARYQRVVAVHQRQRQIRLFGTRNKVVPVPLKLPVPHPPIGRGNPLLIVRDRFGGKTATGRAWVYVRDDAPFGGADPPAALFRYSRDRSGDHPVEHLRSFTGILQADAYAGYNRLYAAGRSPGPVTEAACWSHSRRKFFELADIAASKRRGKNAPPISPVALEAVKRIDVLFDIERGINGKPTEQRLAARQQLSAPVLADLKGWMQAERKKLSRHSPVAKAMDYMLRRWDRFARFLDDGRICLTNNAAERALRGIALGRKSWLFCGSDRGGVRAAAMYTLIGTAKLNNVDPQAWLADVLGKIAGTPQSQLDELLPWNWQDNRRHDRAA